MSTASLAAGTVAFEAKGVSKRFGGVHALNAVSLRVLAGEIRAVVGENGAGKSTLMRIIAGLEAPDDGTTEAFGELLPSSPAAARDAGIALVHQELSLVPTLSVAENICLGDPPRVGGIVRARALRSEADAVMRRVHAGIDVRETVGRLSLARRQFVEIAKALRQMPRILILDEPTAALTLSETDHLAELVQRLATEGISVIFVSHRISEVFGLCSTATVLKDGRNVAEVELAGSTPEALVRLMVGRDLEQGIGRPAISDAPIVLSVDGLSTLQVQGVSFDLHKGEILGIGGLVGAGRSELVRAACRLDPISGGRCEVRAEDKMVPLRSYRQAIKCGIAFVPEDRHLEGLATDLTVGDNLSVPSARSLSKGGLLWQRSLRAFGRHAVSRYDIRPPRPALVVSYLSGGNQQKVVLAKWLLRSIRVLILDEPTRGVDVGAKAQVHELLRLAADEGVGVLVVSSDLPELLELSHRILVMRDGQLTGVLSADEASEETIMQLATP